MSTESLTAAVDPLNNGNSARERNQTTPAATPASRRNPYRAGMTSAERQHRVSFAVTGSPSPGVFQTAAEMLQREEAANIRPPAPPAEGDPAPLQPPPPQERDEGAEPPPQQASATSENDLLESFTQLAEEETQKSREEAFDQALIEIDLTAAAQHAPSEPTSAPQQQSKRKKLTPVPIDKRIAATVNSTITEPRLKTIRNKALELATKMVALNQEVRLRTKALSAWTNRDPSDPYIVRSANITMELTCSKMIRGDVRTTDLQAKFMEMRETFKKEASSHMRSIAELELEAATKHRFEECIRHSASVMETCLQLAIHLEDAGNTERSTEAMSRIVLIQCLKTILDDDFFSKYLNTARATAVKEAIRIFEPSDTQKQKELLVPELTITEKALQGVTILRFSSFYAPVTQHLQATLDEEERFKHAEFLCALEERKRKKQKASKATAQALDEVTIPQEATVRALIENVARTEFQKHRAKQMKTSAKNDLSETKTSLAEKPRGKKQQTSSTKVKDNATPKGKSKSAAKVKNKGRQATPKHSEPKPPANTPKGANNRWKGRSAVQRRLGRGGGRGSRGGSNRGRGRGGSNARR